MRAVNLLPRDLERQRGEGSRAPLFVAAGGIAAATAAAAVLFMSASSSISDQQGQLDSLRAAVARIPTAGQPAVAPGAIAQERADRVAALSAALTTQVPLDSLLGALAYVLPEDAWLTGMTASAPAAAPTGTTPGTPAAAPATAQGVTIQGATYSHLSVARVLARLSAVPSLENVRLTATSRVEPAAESGTSTAKTQVARKKQRTVVTFTIDANIAGSGS